MIVANFAQLKAKITTNQLQIFTDKNGILEDWMLGNL